MSLGVNQDACENLICKMLFQYTPSPASQSDLLNITPELVQFLTKVIGFAPLGSFIDTMFITLLDGGQADVRDPPLWRQRNCVVVHVLIENFPESQQDIDWSFSSGLDLLRQLLSVLSAFFILVDADNYLLTCYFHKVA